MSCLNCDHLDRSRKRQVGNCYQYGCTAALNGYMSTWINVDSLLGAISCEVDRKAGEAVQMDMFRYLEGYDGQSDEEGAGSI